MVVNYASLWCETLYIHISAKGRQCAMGLDGRNTKPGSFSQEGRLAPKVEEVAG